MAITHRHDDEIRVDDLKVIKRWSVLGTQITATAAEINAALGGITAGFAELNILDGALLDVTELNILNGLLVSTGELNILNGAVLDVNELNLLNGVLATTAELNLVDNQVAGATIVVSSETSNDVTIDIQFTDAEGNDMATPVAVPWYLADDVAGLDPATAAPDGGVVIGTDGALIESVDNLSGLIISEADGDVDLISTDSGTLTKYLVLVMPTGALVISGAITTAA